VTEVLRLAAFDTVRALGAWRWLAVPPVFFVAGWLGADNAEYDYATQAPRDANLWDGPLTMMTDPTLVALAFLLGFAIVAGDLYVRDRASGTAAMTLVRSRSRSGWWAAKIFTLAPLALAFSFLALLSSLAAAAIRLPLSPGWSPASQAPWGSESSLYPSVQSLAPPLFLLLVALYTALVLWAVGALVLAASAVHPRLVTPLAAALAWALAGTGLVSSLASREGLGRLDPAYHLSYVVHFGNDRGFTGSPWSASLAIVAVAIASALLVGAWSVRRTDV
jgi:ABC-type transport system involved in multi-copper enzyme maturation permease subunit